MKSSIYKVQFLFLLVLILFSTTAVSQNCNFQSTPDLPLMPSTQALDSEISVILNRYKLAALGSTRPSETKLISADNAFQALNLSIINGAISGVQVDNTYAKVLYLMDYAKEYALGSLSPERKQNAINTIWLVLEQICNGSLIQTFSASVLYNFDNFSVPAVFFYKELNPRQQELFAVAMEKYGALKHFWSADYNTDTMIKNGAIDTDQIYNNGNILLAFCAQQPTADERYRWMRAYKRWLDRFTTYTNTTCDGLKPDGTGFHHWTAYDNYMYAFQTCCNSVYYTSGTTFQIGTENYLRFRDAVFAQIVFGNNAKVKPLAMCGRKPHERPSMYSQTALKNLAVAGGRILGITTADPEMASQYNRLFGTNAELNYTVSASTSRTDGFYQFNYANMGIFRKNGWLAGMKGFTDGAWGSEIYVDANRYGRYQSYGAMEIIYEGDLKTGNGYDPLGWNWNYNPGTTTRILSWNDLNGEKERTDELQNKSFAGALAFDLKNSATLNSTHGRIGMFGMDFQGKEGLGWGTVYHSNTHDATFKFKKSTFVFDDIILCLGSNISSSTSAPVVTTLFQRLNNKGNVIINGATAAKASSVTLIGKNWMISNYNTGFYIPSGNGDVYVSNITEKTPYHNELDPLNTLTNNVEYDKWIGYLSHGIQPQNAKYEYVVLPNTTTALMNSFDKAVLDGNKPYAIHQQDASAHIVQHLSSNVWGYAIFTKGITINNPGIISSVSDSCLIMYQSANSKVKMSVSNPIFGISYRKYNKETAKTITVTVKGKWDLTNAVDGVSVISKSDIATTFAIKTEFGKPYEFEFSQGTSSTNIVEDDFQNLSFYPNPFTTTLCVNNAACNHIVFYNLLGRSVFSKYLIADSDIILQPSYSELPKGLYFLKFFSDKSAKMVKVVRE